MRNSKINSILIFTLAFLPGCISSSYKVDHEDEGRTQLLVTPNRVKIECKLIEGYEGDIKDAQWFTIYVLDESKTVLTVSQGNILGKEDCLRRIDRVGHILKDGSQIFIGGMGNLNKPRETPERFYAFPGLGKFPENRRNLQFMVIWNEKGMCYNAYSGDQKPCPSDEFPIK